MWKILGSKTPYAMVLFKLYLQKSNSAETGKSGYLPHLGMQAES